MEIYFGKMEVTDENFRDDGRRIAWFSKFEEEMDMKKCVKAISLKIFFEGEPGNGEKLQRPERKEI